MSTTDVKVCPSCNTERPLSAFYKKAQDCRACIRTRAGGGGGREKLLQDVERHRQSKEYNKLIRTELKRMARQRLRARRDQQKKLKRKQVETVAEQHAGQVEVSPAVRELARRELARRKLIEFIKTFHPRYKAGWVHHDICAALEKFAADVAAGRSPRLMILMPPRHGKSQIASKLFPAWVLGHYNWFEVMACSYNVSLALEFSREVREVVRSEPYSMLFPQTKINPDAQAAEAWRLLSDTGVGSGGYVAAGIGGPITGKGAHILIIDDPIKNAEEAESAEHRQKIWDWYRSTAYTRLAPGGGVLVIQTCWHDDDMAGKMQAEMKDDPDADQFTVVKYPAIAIEDEQFRMQGEALHPDRYDEAALAQIKRTVGPRYWAALYQQDPVPDEGAYFTKDMIHHRRTGSVDLSRCDLYQAWDFAISEKRASNWNVGVTIALDESDNAHIIEMRRFRTKDSAEICENILDMYEGYAGKGMQQGGVKALSVEDGQIWRGMLPYLQKRMTERRIYPYVEVQKPLTDKQVRARPLQGRMQQGKVTFPASAGWTETAVKELLRFPTGSQDDVVDALAWGMTMIMLKSPPRPPRTFEGRKPPETLADKLRKLGHRLGGGGSMSA